MATSALTEKSGSKSQLGKLKPVPLPKFDGNILEFKSFWAQFEVSIDRREDLGAITKFLHLRSCLSGAALKAIEGITVCAENYPEVVQTLHNRFHRVPEVVESHVLKVVSLKECSDDGAADLTRLLDDLNRHFLELRALGKDVDANLSGFHALLPIIKKKLPPDTLEAWRAFVQELTNEKITSSVFLSFLLNQSQIKGSARKMPARKPERRAEQGERFMTATIQVDPVGNCVVCCGIYPVESCPRFVELSGPELWQCVRKHGLCFGCLRKGHRRGSCQQNPDRPGQHPLLALQNPHRRQNRRRTRRPAASRNARPAAQPDAAVKEKNPTTAPAQDLEAEDAASDRAATELAPVGVHFSSTVRAPGVLLPVVQAMAYGENGKKRLVNCLLDSASEKSLIRTDVADELETLASVRVPRALMVSPKDQVRRSELHVFGDASETAFGAVAYLMTESMDGAKEVRFCLAKIRVAPVRRLSLPRLELMAALHVARLKEYVERELGLPFNRSTCWSDSTIVLSWIRGDPRRWKPFVANRVQEILSRTEPSQWRHCPTADNPADKLSRGCALDTLREDKLWWNGPAWLKEPNEQWPRLTMALSPEETRLVSPERKRVVTLCASLKEPGLLAIIDPSRYGTMERLVRVTAYCCRAQLSLLELQDAEKRWVRAVQAEAFPVSKTASGPIPVRAGDPLAALSPFVDTEGLLRVGGRLSRTALPWCHRHPLLLPRNGPVVEPFVRRTHESELHAGLNQTLAALRRRFWVVRGRQAVKRCIRACIICRKHDARPFCPLMSDLPPERVIPSFPFNRVGLDFAGPLYVKDEHQPAQKAYICLFTCMVTRAVHLEVVFDMTTISFLAALRRFIARRGRPSVIHTDNFRTFKQADSFMRDLLRGNSAGKIREKLAMRQIEWKYSTDRAPWCGGYWERLVRSMKNALRKVLGKALLRSWELHTVLCELEARINDRPLTLLSEDPHDCAPLTPAHFLIGRELASLPIPAASASAPTNASSCVSVGGTSSC
ncbi:Pao retrotransposon peptidase family protein [Trichinella spiralis]|nr:Pao retrotransposon peptidase family protein [Trichinella spiralis]